MIKVNNYFRYSWVLESSPDVTDYSILAVSKRCCNKLWTHQSSHKWAQSSDRYPVRRFGGKIRECSCLISKLILRKVLRHSPSLSFELRKSHKIVAWCSGLSQSSEHCAPPTKNNMRGYRIWWITYETVRVGGGVSLTSVGSKDPGNEQISMSS